MTLHRYPNRREWLRHRRIGSSEVPAILGLSTYARPSDVWDRLRRRNGPGDDEEVDLPPDEEESEVQERGRRLEPYVLRRYEAATGIAVERTPPFVLYSRGEWGTATPDARASDEVDLVEAKTDRIRERWGPAVEIERWHPRWGDVVRRVHYLQVQHQLWVLDRRVADLAVLLPSIEDPFRAELRVYRLHRDDRIVSALVERLEEWWDTHVVRRIPPPPDGGEGLDRYHASIERKGRRPATAAEVALAATYQTAKETRNTYDEIRKGAGQALVALAGSCKTIDLPAGRVSIVTSQGSTRLDEARLLADHPRLRSILDQYRTAPYAYSYPRITLGKPGSHR